ncbi:MFS transporter [Streptomyces sp. NBC_00370]|uniref:MFS transporter n=1 Tax=Streptomyces sp. NBC_00370 TaxID=2975728 RepID=UPI002E2522B6
MRRFTDILPPPGPVRVLQTNNLIATIGYGLYTSGSAIFFVKESGISPSMVGLGFSAAGLAGVLLSMPIGRLADRWNSRDVSIACSTVLALLLIAAVFVHSFWEYLPVITGIGIVEAGGNVARGSLLAELVPKEQRVRTAAYSRVVTNIGFSLGALCAGVVLGVNTRAAYASLILGMAVAALAAAALSLRLPRPRSDRMGAGKETSGTRTYDLPYIAVSVVSSTTLIGNTVLTVGLPLWIITHTAVPPPLAAWMILGNTLLVIALQVRMSRGSDTVAGARRMQRGAFAVLALACASAAAVAELSTLAATGVLLVTVALLTLGELWGESANWSFRYGLAPDNAHGAYGGMYALGGSLPNIVGPVVVTFCTARFVPGGWFILASIFVAGLLANGPVISWAERTRTPEDATSSAGQQAGTDTVSSLMTPNRESG